jgi:hypothetical protein
MKSGKRALATIGLAGVLAVLGGGTLITSAANADVTYKAELASLNEKTTGSRAGGEATFTISGDRLTIHVTAMGAPPNMEHLQHFHGFAKGDRTSRCPATGDDKNGDGIIDIVETEPAAGTTMVPFDANPIGMSAVNDTFPRAGADGSYSYEKTVSLKALEAAFTTNFPGQKLDLDRRVVFLHGVPTSTKLPATAASLDHLPAQMLLPIACGEIKKLAE